MERVSLISNQNNNLFYNYIVSSIRECNSFHFSVAFISTGAVQLLVDVLDEAKNKGIKGRILTTDYMFGTDPKALKRLLKYPNIEVRVFKTLYKNIRGFHTKGYHFDKNDHVEVSIGSSNLTEKSLKTNHEWNLSYYSKDNDELINRVYQEFHTLWDDENVILLNEDYIHEYEKAYNHEKYSKSKQQELFKQLAEFLRDNTDTELINTIATNFDIDPSEVNDFIGDSISRDQIKPNIMQENALESLTNLRKIGVKKGLVIAATGTGKTYLAAFDALQVNPKKLLFIVHREKILKDAMKTFLNVMDVKAGLYTGN
jgi:HKD family nuclease